MDVYGGGGVLCVCVCGSNRMLEGISMVMSAFCDCRGFNKVSFFPPTLSFGINRLGCR